MMPNKIFIIAEAGVNHNGSLALAKELVSAAAKAGADAVKFQTFQAEKIVTRKAVKAAYQREATPGDEPQFDMLKRLELSQAELRQIRDLCRVQNILFLSTPFDFESVDILHALGMAIFKIPSGEITNLPLLRKIGSLQKKVILSTGMADMQEIKDALEVLTAAGTDKTQITVLHCTTQYPAPFAEVNLQAMVSIKNELNVQVGYSDHTAGIEIPIAAAALGAQVIEKHFTLDKNLAGPDHKASLTPPELAAMVSAIRNTEKAMGNGQKKPSASELENITVVRRSIVASRPIRRGEKFTEENVTVKRPAGGISPMSWDQILGQKAPLDFAPDEPITL